jgi:hypothetical protein
MMMFAGISNAIYETKNTASAMLYWLVVRFKSLAREKSCAFPIFTLLKHNTFSLVSSKSGHYFNVPVDESHEIDKTENWENPQIDLHYQFALIDS